MVAKCRLQLPLNRRTTEFGHDSVQHFKYKPNWKTMHLALNHVQRRGRSADRQKVPHSSNQSFGLSVMQGPGELAAPISLFDVRSQSRGDIPCRQTIAPTKK